MLRGCAARGCTQRGCTWTGRSLNPDDKTGPNLSAWHDFAPFCTFLHFSAPGLGARREVHSRVEAKVRQKRCSFPRRRGMRGAEGTKAQGSGFAIRGAGATELGGWRTGWMRPGGPGSGTLYSVIAIPYPAKLPRASRICIYFYSYKLKARCRGPGGSL